MRTVAVAMLLAFGSLSADAATVVVGGDSWADYIGIPNTEFPAVFESRGDTRTINNIAVAGTTCAQWATGNRLQALLNAVKPETGATHLWMICGGNDAQFELIGCSPQDECIKKVTDKMTVDLGHILDEVKRVNPQLRVVGFGYDLMGFGSIIGNVLSRAILPACNGGAQCVNSDISLLQGVYDTLGAAKTNFDVVNLLGSLQAHVGVAGAAVGSPVLDQWSPNNLFDFTAIHPTREGYRVVFENLYDLYFAKSKPGLANATSA